MPLLLKQKEAGNILSKSWAGKLILSYQEGFLAGLAASLLISSSLQKNHFIPKTKTKSSVLSLLLNPLTLSISLIISTNTHPAPPRTHTQNQSISALSPSYTAPNSYPRG